MDQVSEDDLFHSYSSNSIILVHHIPFLSSSSDLHLLSCIDPFSCIATVISVEDAEKFVASHGLPIIIKAAHGGGGRGMRVVRTKQELAEAFSRAQSEAKAAFGDGTVFIE